MSSDPQPSGSHAGEPAPPKAASRLRWPHWTLGVVAAALLIAAAYSFTGRPKPARGQGQDAPNFPVRGAGGPKGAPVEVAASRSDGDSPDGIDSSPSSTRNDGGEAAASPDQGKANAPASEADALLTQRKKRIVGRWTREYYGRWMLTIEPDGGGSMTVDPDRLWALIIGPRVTISMRWKIENDDAVFDTIGGEPPAAFEAAMKLWKKHQERKIIELTDEKFVYLSDDGKSHSVWTRAPDEPADAAAPR